MTAQNKTVIKSYLVTDATPTETQFANLVDSYQNAFQVEGSANATGTAQASALAVTTEFTRIAVVSAGTRDGVIVSAIPGKPYRIFNRGTDALKLYPESGTTINALGNNNPFTVSASASIGLVYISSVQSYTY